MTVREGEKVGRAVGGAQHPDTQYMGAEVSARGGPLESTAASLPASLRKLVLHNNLL